ncbi:major facilitator superfamily domain-containing protein [Penicillium chermesinum]|nr:major facilitator superfamily domain-containing protein [Penicillium chermesinum]
MDAVIREAPIGQIIRYLTNNKYLQYPEEKPGFQLPETWVQMLHSLDGAKNGSEKPADREHQSFDRSESSSNRDTEISRTPTLNAEDRLEANAIELEKVQSIPVAPRKTRDGTILVDWYYTDDVENPHNWGNVKRALITSIICLYTFVVYMTSSIYTSSEQDIMEIFHVGEVVVSLGLALYVLAYGLGPLFFSPLGEIPVIGRNPVYIVTMFLFVIISIPTALVNNFPGLLVLRFLQGFFGSPCLASGGASIGDMYSLNALPYAMMAWVSAAYCGPALAPLLSGFAVPVENWHWSLYESVWASAPVFIVMLLFLPETGTPTILLRRAHRLRKIYNTDRFMSQSEIDQRNLKVSEVAIDALLKPMEITIKDPAVLFVQVYTAIIYGIYYSFFEVFPLVYPVDYGMSLGQVGLVFLCILVACILGILSYMSYLYFYQGPRIAKFGFPVHEDRLIPALPAAVGPTVGLFLFAWTANASIHWIVPTIGITIYGGTVFVVMQCLFVYIPLSYPKYAASLFAANDFFRSALACGSILFAHPLFGNLGVARGTERSGWPECYRYRGHMAALHLWCSSALSE